MRPIRRGEPQIRKSFINYKDARDDLIINIGSFCSYCERPITSSWEIEHVQPKSLTEYSHLTNEWTNFLFACKTCNAIKSNKNVIPDTLLLPDRDNTFLAFRYIHDGMVSLNDDLQDELKIKASNTLNLMGLDRYEKDIKNPETGETVVNNRRSQRMVAWLQAIEALEDLLNAPNSHTFRKTVIYLAKTTGFFSIWMNVFKDDLEMRNLLINAFEGTRASGCFNEHGEAITPAPNPDKLPSGGKL